MQQVVVNNKSIGPIGLLWVAFIVLKLMHVIHWSWWVIVFFPLWSVLAISGTMLAVGGILWGLAGLFDKLGEKKCA